MHASRGGQLTGLVSFECFVRLVPKCLAVLLQFEEAVLLPRAGANLDQLPADEQELQIRISFQTWRSGNSGERSHINTRGSGDKY